MGLTNVTASTAGGQPLTNSVYLLDPDGSIKSLDIPFHLALRYAQWCHGRSQGAVVFAI